MNKNYFSIIQKKTYFHKNSFTPNINKYKKQSIKYNFNINSMQDWYKFKNKHIHKKKNYLNSIQDFYNLENKNK